MFFLHFTAFSSLPNIHVFQCVHIFLLFLTNFLRFFLPDSLFFQHELLSFPPTGIRIFKKDSF